jgi:hypothetical protein
MSAEKVKPLVRSSYTLLKNKDKLAPKKLVFKKSFTAKQSKGNFKFFLEWCLLYFYLLSVRYNIHNIELYNRPTVDYRK